MNAISRGMRKHEFTDQQRRFVTEMASGDGNMTRAATLAGYSFPDREGWKLMQNPVVVEAVKKAREKLIHGECASLALTTMKSLMLPGNPAGTRFNAAKYFLDAAGHGAKEQDGEQKSLDEMSPDELAEQIKKLDEALVKIGDQAKPVSTMVIENESGTKGA